MVTDGGKREERQKSAADEQVAPCIVVSAPSVWMPLSVCVLACSEAE